MKEKISGIYLITNVKNGKVYIGEAKDIYIRKGKVISEDARRK